LALSVATVDAAGRPNVRTVLMRFFDERGPGFVTGTESTKGREIAATGGIAAALTWPAMFRAIRFRGVAQELSRDEVAGYFGSRPWASRISAWASRQSQPIEGRVGLEQAYARYAAQFPDNGSADDVPVPDFWGGYRVVCDEVEFWGGRSNRLHDRLVFTRVAEGSLDDAAAWALSRRQP
jgi:pyridoxamine 5'-phosphate oxidase